MSLYGSLDKTKHLNEFDEPLVTNEGVLTPAVRRARALANLGVTATAAELNTLDVATPGVAEASKAVVLGASKEISGIGAADFVGRVTTTDGVASGTAKVVGGIAFSGVNAADNLLASAGGSAHVDFAQTYSIPANTLKAGSVLRIKGYVRVTDASGTDTLEVKLYLGGTTLLTTTAFDPDAADDFVYFEAEYRAQAAPGAAVGIAGMAKWVSEDGTVQVVTYAPLAPTNHATNGALIVKVSAKWSATTANTNARLEMLSVEII